jgi:hypothetical protein
MGAPVSALVVGRGRAAGLRRAIDAAARRHREIVVLTDDRETLPPLPPNVAVIEPEDLLDAGVSRVEDAFTRGASTWLSALFRGSIAGFPANELLWVDTFRQDTLVDRIYDVALAAELFRRHHPRSIALLHPLPQFCATLRDEARRRGIAVEEAPAARVRATVSRAVSLPIGACAAGALIARHALAELRRVRGRRRVRDALASHRQPTGPLPSVWIAISKFRQPSRHVIQAVLERGAARGIPVGVAYTSTFGEARPDTPGEIEEAALLDGRAASVAPAAASQLSGAETYRDGLGTLIEWLPRATRACARCLRHAAAFRVDGQVGSTLDDLPGLLRVATNGMLRTLSAARATERWLDATPTARCVVFGAAGIGDMKVADLLIQRRGIHTIDYVHCLVCEGDLRTTFRTCSECTACWTRLETKRFARMGSSKRQIGGFMPRPRKKSAQDRSRATILVTTNYLYSGSQEIFQKNLKYARRLAQAVVALRASLSSEVEVVLRPHPEEDRAAWTRLLGDSAVPLSEEPDLAADLARAALVVSTNSSSVIEALLYDVPVLLHRAPPVEPDSLYGRVAAERLFATPAELVARVHRLLETDDLEPERRLLNECFGPAGLPADVLDLILSIRSDGRDPLVNDEAAPSNSSFGRV